MELYSGKGFSSVIGNLILGIDSFNLKLSVGDGGSKVIVVDGNVLGARAKLGQSSQLDGSGVVFKHFAIDFWCRWMKQGTVLLE